MGFSLSAWLPLPVHKLPARRVAANAPMPAAEVVEERQLLSATLLVNPLSSAPGVFHTIQAAVNAAQSGDTIEVASGTYDESVTVNVPLTILGGQHDRTGQTGPSIVQSGTAAFTLSSNDVVLEGFTIESPTTPASGIVTGTAQSGDVIDDNVIENEQYGLVLNSQANAGTTSTTVRGNQFVNNVDDIFSDQTLWNALIGSNKFTGSTGAAVDLVGSSQSNIEILNNRISNDGPIVLANTTNSEIEDNTITDSNGDGIELAGGVATTLVSGNTLRGSDVQSDSSAPSVNGIELNSSIANPSNNEDQISGNTVHEYVDGILMTSAQSDAVSNNTTNLNTGTGITTGDATSGVTLNGNTAQNNSLAGFSIDGDDNAIGSNVAHTNGGDGFDISGNEDTITGNRAGSNQGDGFLLSGSDATVKNNVGNYDKLDGFVLNQLTASQFSGNSAYNDGEDGIELVDATDNTLLSNIVQFSGNDGIQIDSESTGNLIEDNNSQYSRHYDLDDASSGAGDAGTANFYSGNIAQKRSPGAV
jgi:parallel beta-helix repeat protein